MDSKLTMSIWVCLVLVLCIGDVHGQSSNNVFMVTNFGAIPDGKTDNTKAFMDAWSMACKTNGARIEVPNGNFLLNGANFDGPCNGETIFRNEGTVIASPSTSISEKYWISFSRVDGLTLIGSGTFDGNGESTWSQFQDGKVSETDRPMSIDFYDVRNSIVRDIHSVDSKMFHFHITNCENILVNNVHIKAPGDSPNTDGIHIANSNDIQVTNSQIGTGDDCISLGPGNTNINISSIWCGPGHGISIGSLGRDVGEEDVRGITVKNCTFTSTSNGLRIKTFARQSGPSIVSDVTFQDIQVDNVENPIIIDQFYCPHSSCGDQAQSTVQISGVKFIDIRGSSASEVAVDVQCSKARPCQNILFLGLNLTIKATAEPAIATCSNVLERFLGRNQVPSQC